MHLYKSGGHGFGMHNPTTNDRVDGALQKLDAEYGMGW